MSRVLNNNILLLLSLFHFLPYKLLFDININWRDVQIKNVVYNVDMSSLRAPWQYGPYKN